MLCGAEKYRVYKDGTILKLKQTKTSKYTKRAEIKHQWRLVVPIIRGEYLAVTINGEPILVHRLVASMFVHNDDIDKKLHVHHKDEDPTNNDADNLQWVTPKEHMGIHMLLRQKTKLGAL